MKDVVALLLSADGIEAADGQQRMRHLPRHADVGAEPIVLVPVYKRLPHHVAQQRRGLARVVEEVLQLSVGRHHKQSVVGADIQVVAMGQQRARVGGEARKQRLALAGLWVVAIERLLFAHEELAARVAQAARGMESRRGGMADAAVAVVAVETVVGGQPDQTSAVLHDIEDIGGAGHSKIAELLGMQLGMATTAEGHDKKK